MSLGVLLFVIFLVLKLVGVIAWSWWLVTLPLWIGLALTLAIYVLGLIGVGVFAAISRAIRPRKF